MTAPLPFVLEVPARRVAERRYVAKVLFGELLGLECAVEPSEVPCPVLQCAGATGRIRIAEGLFGIADDLWLRPESVPAASTQWVVPEAVRPPLVGATLPMVYPPADDSAEAGLNADLFGTAFWSLTRYEEVAVPAPSLFGRHDPFRTLAGQENWITRPVVNEIAEVLWAAVRRQWPGVRRGSRSFRLLVTHDIDHPRCVAGKSAVRLLGGAMAEGARAGWRSGVRRLDEWMAVRRRGPGADPCWTFDFLMQESERRGLRSAFYFIPGAAAGSEYSLRAPEFRALTRQIVERGHEVGFHPSHAAADRPAAFDAELAEVRAAVAEAGGDTTTLGGRHHYIRWYAGRSWEQWEAAGLAYDSSVGYVEVPGFRAGICAEYPAFDLRTGRVLRLRERPLVAMDVSLTGPEGLALPVGDAVSHAIELGRTCRKFGGDFVFLWHNSNVRSPEMREAYLAILDGV